MSNLSEHFLGTKSTEQNAHCSANPDVQNILDVAARIESDSQYAKTFANGLRFGRELVYEIRDLYHSIPEEAQVQASIAYRISLSHLASEKCELSPVNKRATMTAVRAAIVGTLAAPHAYGGSSHSLVSSVLSPFYLTLLETSFLTES